LEDYLWNIILGTSNEIADYPDRLLGEDAAETVLLPVCLTGSLK
jgi:hypothetical protein